MNKKNYIAFKRKRIGKKCQKKLQYAMHKIVFYLTKYLRKYKMMYFTDVLTVQGTRLAS